MALVIQRKRGCFPVAKSGQSRSVNLGQLDNKRNRNKVQLNTRCKKENKRKRRGREKQIEETNRGETFWLPEERDPFPAGVAKWACEPLLPRWKKRWENGGKKGFRKNGNFVFKGTKA